MKHAKIHLAGRHDAIIDHRTGHADDISGGVERVARVARITQCHGAGERAGARVAVPTQTKALRTTGS